MRALCLLVLAACGSVPPAGPDAGSDPGPDAGGETPPDYASLFPEDRLVDVDIDMGQEGWDALMADPLVDLYVPATLTYDGVVLEVSVRLKGNSSRRSVYQMGSQRYSFKVDIDYLVPGQELHGVDKINFNNGFKDPTSLRERLANDLYRDFGLAAVHTAHARLSINGSYFGLYTVVEQVDREFLRSWFPDDSGDLFKPEMPDGDLTWRGDSLADYPNLGLETNEDAADHPGILRFLDVLNHTADADLAAALPAVLDVDRLLRYLAVTTALSSLDSYLGMGHNYYLYEDLGAGGRWAIVPWDANEAYGNFWCQGMEAADLIDLPPEQPGCGDPARKPLLRVLDVPAWRDTYLGYLGELIAGPWEAGAVSARVDALADLVRAAVAEDPTAFFTPSEFETNLDTDLGRTFGLTSFAARRTAALDARLP